MVLCRDFIFTAPLHAQFSRYVNEPGNFTSINTDGHLRSVFFGRSETLTIKDGKLDVGDRKYNNGEEI